jgi:hypothetical protein
MAFVSNQTTTYVSKADSWGKFIRVVIVVFLAVFPWMVLPNIAQPLELPRELLLFAFSGFLLVVWFFRALAQREFEWRRTKLGWILGLWLLVLGLLFLYSKNFQVGWQGYPGSLTGGLSEYLAFIIFYLVAVQVFSAEEWRRNLSLLANSLTYVLIFFIIATVYYRSNAILTINFAKTPTLVTAAAGVLALSLWWTTKHSEEIKKGGSFILVLVLFFITSLLDFHISFWMWVAGAAVILVFDLISRKENWKQEKETIQLGIGKAKSSFVKLFLHGDAKYLFLILLFALSRAISPVFFGEQEITVFPFMSFLIQYPLLGQKVIFYLLINFIVFCLGVYYFFRIRKERPAVVTVMSGLLAISLGHLLYYSESAIFYLLNWSLLIFAGVTFLRLAPEKDFLYLIKPKSKGEGVLAAISVGVMVVVAVLVFLRFREIFT